MHVLVRDDGFHKDDWTAVIYSWEQAQTNPFALEDNFGLEVPSSTNAYTLKNFIKEASMIIVVFDHCHDGRGFTLARMLRLMGYKKRLRARGHILADQYTMARRVGFDEIEISKELASRQSEEQWLFRANWNNHDYQKRLRNQ